ncbi:MAG TPA: hypothetical protein VF755_01825 [Catenuloplanes sp.]|jgi:hypothetical protein
MSDIKALLVRAVGDRPSAPTIDRETAIVAGRRALRRRRTMQVAGVLAATTGLAVGGVLAVGPIRGTAPGRPLTTIAGPAAPATSAPVPPAGCPAGETTQPGGACLPAQPPMPTEPAAAAKPRLTGVLTAAVRQVLPAAKVVRHRDLNQAALVFAGDRSGYKSGAQVTTGPHTGTLLVSLSSRAAESATSSPKPTTIPSAADGPGQAGPTPTSRPTEGPGGRSGPTPSPKMTQTSAVAPYPACTPAYPPAKLTFCKSFVGPRGELVEERTHTSGDKVAHLVNIIARDGTTVSAMTDNSLRINGGATSAAAPMTLRQLRDIVLTDGLTLYP